MFLGKKLWLAGLVFFLVYLTVDSIAPNSVPKKELNTIIYKRDSLNNSSLYTIPGFSGQQIDSLKNATKVYYVSFWASWCSACIANFKFSKRLQHDYANKPITFLYISLDEEETVWKNSIMKYGLSTSKNFRVPDFQGHPFVEKHQIKELPRYMVFDKNGEVLYSAAPRPSNPEIKEVLDELLQK